jgi:hypothetical protein
MTLPLLSNIFNIPRTPSELCTKRVGFLIALMRNEIKLFIGMVRPVMAKISTLPFEEIFSPVIPGKASVGSAVGDTVGAAVGVSVGESDGTGVGASVGEAVGTAVGVYVGPAVGTAVGTPVGIAVGAVVGTPVGMAVGAVVGAEVGAADGASVGALVGVDVGAFVGAPVGDKVGPAVGDVGALVGAAVGAVVGASVDTVSTPLNSKPDGNVAFLLKTEFENDTAKFVVFSPIAVMYEVASLPWDSVRPLMMN